jgi:hypothetical protein
MNGIRLATGIWLWRHGWWLPLTTLIVAAAAWLWWIDAELLRVELQALNAPRTPSLATQPSDDDSRYAALRAALQPHDSATRQVQRLIEITQPHLVWRQAEFQHTEDRPLDLVRVQVSVPVSGEYRRLRAALDTALREMPNLSIDQVLFQRQSVGETQLNARIRFSLWMRAPAPSSVHKGPHT